MTATRTGRLPDVEDLLARGVAPSAGDEQGASAVQRADERSTLDLVSLACVRVRRDPIRSRSRTSAWVCETAYYDIVLTMVDAGLTNRADTEAARLERDLVSAALHGEADRIPQLARQGANVNALHRGRPAPVWAAFWGHTDAVRSLMEAGADPRLVDSAAVRLMDHVKQFEQERPTTSMRP